MPFYEPSKDGIFSAMTTTMQTTIDAGGRIVVPKAIRDQMGLTPGTKIDIAFVDGRIEIDVAPTEFDVVMKGRVPVFMPRHRESLPPLTDEIIRDTLEAVRDRRL